MPFTRLRSLRQGPQRSLPDRDQQISHRRVGPARRAVSLLAVIGSIALVLALAPVAVAAPGGAHVLPASSHPYGQSYSEWSAAWWEWALAQPGSTNPILDATGEQCANDQSGQVWFLAGAFGEAERECAVPAGQALFFPVVNIVYCAFPEDPPEQRTEEFVRGIVDPIAANATGLSATVDGEPITDIGGRFYVESSLFAMVLGPDNVFGAPVGQVIDPCASAGYWLFLPPLPPGEHTITFSGTLPDAGFSNDVTYYLTVG